MTQDSPLSRSAFEHIHTSKAHPGILADLYNVSAVVVNLIQDEYLQADQVVDKDPVEVYRTGMQELAKSWINRRRFNLLHLYKRPSRIQRMIRGIRS